VLAVVEDEQQALVGQVRDERVPQVLAPGLADAERAGDGGQDEGGVGHGGELDEEGAVAEGVEGVGGGLEGEARLADPAGARSG
jgi:hypothetical protein